MALTKTTTIITGVCLALALSSCSGGDKATGTGSSGGGSGMIPKLVFPSEGGNSAGGLANYNPYSPTALAGTWIYEPMMIRNNLNCDIEPWLATKYTWESPSKLVMDIRDGVKWSDGQPFTAKDVAFTFGLGKQYPAADPAGVWNDTVGSKAESVVAEGNKVTFTFTGNAAAKFDNIIGQKIYPEHIWSKVGDPTKYIDQKPVGTGMFKVKSYNGRQVVLERNATYWQADKIKVQSLVLEGTYEAPQAALKLSAGQLDAYWGEIPNPDKTFVAKNPKLNHFWYANNGMNALAGNNTKPPFNDVKFREAVSYAMNRQDMSLKATYNIMKPASQTGLSLPNLSKFLPDKYKDVNVIPYDVAKSNELLDTAGYKKGADGKRTMPDGSPLAVNFQVQAGYIDYQAMADVIVANLNAVGVSSKVTASPPDSVDGLKKSGDYQAMINYVGAGCNFATGLGATLASNQIPTNKDILANVERFKDADADAAVADLAKTTDPAKQKEQLAVLVEKMMTQFPVTPLIYAPARMIFRTDHAVGWPDEKDPYTNPQDNKLVIMTHLTAP